MIGTGTPGISTSKRSSLPTGWILGHDRLRVGGGDALRVPAGVADVGVPADVVDPARLFEHQRDSRFVQVLDDLREREVLVRVDLLRVVEVDRLMEERPDDDRLAGPLLLSEQVAVLELPRATEQHPDRTLGQVPDLLGPGLLRCRGVEEVLQRDAAHLPHPSGRGISLVSASS